MQVNSDLLQTIENAITESEGDGSVLEEWLKKTKFNINSYDTHGFALIHWAAQKGYTACIEMLIKHGADITNLTSEEKSVYDIAIQYGNTETAEWVKFTMDEVELFQAVSKNDVPLLKKCMADQKCVYFKNRHGMSALHVACFNATHECVSYLVENGFNVNEQDFFGRTPLHWACLNQDIPLIQYLIQNGGDVTVCSLTKKTPVHLCFPFMKEITFPEITQHFPAAFFDAVQRYDRESLRAFFQHNSNEYAASLRNEQGCSALHIAVKAGRSDLVQELLERGFDKHLADRNNITPSLLGVSSNDRIRELLEEEAGSPLSVIQEAAQPEEVLPPPPVIEPRVPSLPPLVIPQEEPVVVMPSPSQVPIQTLTSPVSAGVESRSSLGESAEVAKETSVDDLSKCKTAEELLSRLGFQEYLNDFSKLNCVFVEDFYAVSETQMKEFMKFGHRIMLCEVLRQINPLFTFLKMLNWLERYEFFKELGFLSIWSLLAITKECQTHLNLNDDEMTLLLQTREKFEASKKEDLINCPALMDLKEESDSKPILSMLFSKETTDRLIHVGLQLIVYEIGLCFREC